LLEALGITASEETAYRRLLATERATAGDLAKLAEQSTGEVRAALHSLEAKGLVARSPGKSGRYVPVDPEVALEVLLLRRQAELEHARLSVRRLVEDIRETSRTLSSTEIVEVVRGREAIQQRVIQLQRTARAEVVGMDKPPYATVDEAEVADGNDVEVELLRKGIRYRVLYDRSALELDGTMAHIRARTREGEEARLLEGLPMRLMIADRALALLPLSLRGPDLEEGDILIRASPLLEALVLLFEIMWERGIPVRGTGPDAAVPSPRGPKDATFTEEELLMISLVAADEKDDAIARHLSVAKRTAQRRLSRLMRKMGATSRIQLVIEAVRRGIV